MKTEEALRELIKHSKKLQEVCELARKDERERILNEMSEIEKFYYNVDGENVSIDMEGWKLLKQKLNKEKEE